MRSGSWGKVAQVPGIECAGTVAADPSGRLLAGTAVIAILGGMGRTRNGSYAELVRRVGLSIPTTSQHLAKLRLASIVSARREGRHTYYTVEDPHVLTMIGQIFSHIAADGTLAPDP